MYCIKKPMVFLPFSFVFFTRRLCTSCIAVMIWWYSTCMLRYQKLPAGTSRWLTLAILLTGGCLGYSISINAVIALYGFTGFLSNLFFPGSLPISPHEAVYFGVLGVAAAISATMLSFFAYDMNVLSRRAVFRSRIMWIPTLLVTALLYWQHTRSSFQYHLNLSWCIALACSIVLGGVIPAVVLSTAAARKLHSK